MTRQKTPHTQSQQNLGPEQSDLEPDQSIGDVGADSNLEIYRRNSGAETGQDRASRKVLTRSMRPPTAAHDTAAHEGTVSTRTPRRPVQGVSSHSTQEESDRNAKVISKRPDAQAGINRSR